MFEFSCNIGSVRRFMLACPWDLMWLLIIINRHVYSLSCTKKAGTPHCGFINQDTLWPRELECPVYWHKKRKLHFSSPLLKSTLLLYYNSCLPGRVNCTANLIKFTTEIEFLYARKFAIKCNLIA